MTRSTISAWYKVAGVVFAAGLICTAVAVAEDRANVSSLKRVRIPKKTQQQSPTAAQPDEKQINRGLTGGQQRSNVVATGATSGVPLRRMSIDDADGFAWYNGRKLPIMNATTTPVRSAVSMQHPNKPRGGVPATTSAEAKLSSGRVFVDDAPQAAVPVSCATGVGCQLPFLGPGGIGRGKNGFPGFPTDANLLDDDNADTVLGAVSDTAAGAGGAHSYIAADNFKATANASITKLCWWGIYANIQPVPQIPTGHTGAEECSGATAGSAHDLGTSTGAFSFNLSTATDSTPFSNTCNQYASAGGNRFTKDVWFRWQSPCTGPVTFQTCEGTNQDTKIGVYTDAAVGAAPAGCPANPIANADLKLVAANPGYGLGGKACHDDPFCGIDWQTIVNFNATIGQVYYLRVGLFPATATGGPGIFEIICEDDDCDPQPDNFSVRFYADDVGGTRPGTLLATRTTGGGGLTIDSKFTTGNNTFSFLTGSIAQYQYAATITGVPVTAGNCYWIEIRNNVTGACDWFWQTSEDGDGRSQINIDGAGYVPVATKNDPNSDFDLAFCLNVATDPEGCFRIQPSGALYNENAREYTGVAGSPTTDYVQAYDIQRLGGDTPHGIVYVQSRGGATGCDSSLNGQNIYTLIEFYDEDNSGTAGDNDPCFGKYLGGVLSNLGPYTSGTVSQMSSWFISSPEGTFFVPTGSDDRVYVSFRMGLVNAGVFVAEPTGNTTFDDCTDIDTNFLPTGRMWMEVIIDDPNDPTDLVEVTGNLVSGTYFSDGFGTAPDNDRVPVGLDGPLAWGGNDDGTPAFEMRGDPLLDCDEDGVEDSTQIACFDSAYFGQAGCAANACPIYDALGTGGLYQNPAFMDPLIETGLGPPNCIVGKADIDSSGTLDECDADDCDEDGNPNACELSCDAFDFLHGKPCQDAVDDGDISTCGTVDDCNSNALPDECELDGNDCNETGIPDECEVPPLGVLDDCNENVIPDSCEVGNGESDCDNNGVLDICEVAFLDCNRNGITDQCDLLVGNSNDLNSDDLPDECPDSCVTPFDGFESDPPFTIGQGLDGIDYEMPGNGDTWTGNPVSQIRAQSCAGGGARAYTQNADTSGAADFTSSELFNADAQGSVPTSSNLTEVTFDWKVEGPRNSDNDIRMHLIDFTAPNADSVVLFWFSSDNSAIGADDPGSLNILDNNGFNSTGIQLVAGQCNSAKVIFDNLAQSVEVQISVAGGAFNTVYGPSPNNVLTPGANRIDFFQTSAFNSGSATQTSTGTDAASLLYVDNIQVCEFGAATPCENYKGKDGLPSTDCDGNQVCDVFQITDETDRDDDNVLDICQGFCDDCNHNFVVDSYEIAQGTLVDTTPANGIPDVCEAAYNVDFQNFNVGAVAGQRGWEDFNAQNAEGEIREDNGIGGGGTNRYLAVKSRAGNDNPNGFVMGPRVASGSDGDIEFWSWKMRVRDPAGGSINDWGRVFVEILDLCEDAPQLINNINGIIGARNAGLQVSRLDTNEGDGGELGAGAINVYVLGKPANVPGYELANPAQINDVQLNVLNATYAAGLRIHNNAGTGNAYWALLQDDIDGFPVVLNANSKAIGNATTGETVELIPDVTGALRWRGGDRQLMIRTDGDYGGTDDIEFLFDDFRYTTALDCDGDGQRDSDFILANGGTGVGIGGTHDRNSDGIPDRCQDCDNDCPVFPIALTSRGCLDPCEISAAAPNCGGLGGGSLDCNANGIPDLCDVDSTGQTAIDNAGRPAQNLTLRELYRGGGVCDFDHDEIPDTCEAGFTDCNGNGCHDPYELATAGFGGTATNVNGGPIDECEADCNHNNIPDARDLALGVAGGGSQDADEFSGPFSFDGKPDECCIDGPGGVVLSADGDMDHDGDLDAADYKLLQRCGGQTPPNCPDAGCVNGKGTVRGSATGGINWDGLQCGCGDFNGDGKVEFCDLQVFQTLITGP